MTRGATHRRSTVSASDMPDGAACLRELDLAVPLGIAGAVQFGSLAVTAGAAEGAAAAADAAGTADSDAGGAAVATGSGGFDAGCSPPQAIKETAGKARQMSVIQFVFMSACLTSIPLEANSW